MDWQSIKTEYITTNTSYRKLARKFGIDQATIARRAKKENWVAQKQQYVSDTQAKVMVAAADHSVDRAVRLMAVADMLLDKITLCVEQMEEVEPKSLRALTAAMKDIKELVGLQTDLDRQEQEARIAQLRQRAEKEDGNGCVRVVLEGALTDYAQ